MVDLGTHFGRLRRRAANFRPTFWFEFVPVPKSGADVTKIEESGIQWKRMLICPYAREKGSKISKVVDFADIYMFEISGYQNVNDYSYVADDDVVYQIWPQKKTSDTAARPPRHEQLLWLSQLKEAFAEMETDRVGRSRSQSAFVPPGPCGGAQAEDAAFDKQYMRLPLRVKKGDRNNAYQRQYATFRGSIEAAVYGKKRGSSPLGRYQERLLELLVDCECGEHAGCGKLCECEILHAILRIRKDSHAKEVNSYIDLSSAGATVCAGAGAGTGAGAGAGARGRVSTKGSVQPTAQAIDSGISLGKKGRVQPGAEGMLSLVAHNGGKDGGPREYTFKIPGTITGVTFYNEVMGYLNDAKLRPLPTEPLRPPPRRGLAASRSNPAAASGAPESSVPNIPATRLKGAAAAAAAAAGSSGGGGGNQRRRHSGRFVTETLHLGEPKQAAMGLLPLMGYDEKSIQDLIRFHGGGVAAIKWEIEKHGTDEDKTNLRGLLDGTYQNPPHQDGSAPTKLELASQKRTVEELMKTAEAKRACLEPEHIVALRLYTTTTYKSINDPLRRKPEPKTPLPLAATTYFIAVGLSRMRRYHADQPDAYTPKTFFRGLKDVEVATQFMQSGQGGCEFSCLSTSSDKLVAIEFAIEKRKQKSLIFKIETKDFMDRGADISFLSLYPDEVEMLWPPLMLMKPISNEVAFETVVYGGAKHSVQVIHVGLKYPYS